MCSRSECAHEQGCCEPRHWPGGVGWKGSHALVFAERVQAPNLDSLLVFSPLHLCLCHPLARTPAGIGPSPALTCSLVGPHSDAQAPDTLACLGPFLY